MVALKYRIPLLILLLATLFSRVSAQTDTEFWFVAPEITIGHGNYPGGEPVYFRISALDLDAQVRISQPANPAGMDTTFTVAANTTFSIDASPWIDDLENRPGGIILNKGVQIVSNNLITAYYDEDEYWNQDIFALKGKNALGYEFYTPFQNVWRNGSGYTPLPYSAIDIVATEDNTEITITPTVDFVGGYSAGVPFTITLNRGQTFSCLATEQYASAHAAGTHIESDKPIAVSLKDDSVAGDICRDLIGDQTVPIINAEGSRIVGYEYIVMRGKINLIDPTTNPPDPDGVPTGERIFVMATEPNTKVYIDGTEYATLALPGQEAVYEVRNNSTHVRGDKPVMVLHASGFGCELGGAVLPTIDGCTGSVEVSFTRSTDRDFYLNIMTTDAAKNAFTVHYTDGSTYAIPGTWFEAVGTTDYVCLSKDHKYFGNFRPGGVPQGEVVKITNSVSVFHLGLIEGGNTTGCKYGYFSDYSESRGDVLVVESGSKSIFRCFGDTIQLRSSGGISYSWSPSDYLDDPFVATPIATPPPGIHNYDVTMTRGCFPDTTISVIVGIAEEVEAFFEMDEWYICAPDTVTFDNQSFGVDLSSVNNMQWDFDLDDPSNPYVYDTTSVFERIFNNTSDTIHRQTIQLVVWNQQSCISEFQRDIIVRPEINAGFSPDVSNGCQPLTVNFDNTSTGNTDRYKWDLGDGNSSNTEDVQHTYFNFGMADSLYHVEMVAISPFYCSDTVEADIEVYPYLEAAFAVDTFQGCSPLTIGIKNNSAGYIEVYEWDFGDGQGSASSGAVLYHTFTNATNNPLQYEVSLVVRNDSRGCSDTLKRMITVYPEVLSDFTPDQNPVCSGTEVGFTNNSSITATSFQWDFGDGGSSASSDPSHLFENMTLNNVDYTVSLVSTTDYLCRDTSTAVITTHPYIHAEYSVNEFQGCAPFVLELQNASTGAISDYEWDWDDSTPVSSAAGPVQTHTYENTGPVTLSHKLLLTVANADGCTDTMARTIRVFPEVQSQFSQDAVSGCNELTVGFTNESSPSATNFLWEFGDGASSDVINPSHVFRNPGIADSTYITRLIAATPENCRDTSEVDIQVWSFIKADFTFAQATLCSPFELNFTNTSVGGTSFHWDFGDTRDTTVDNTNQVSHIFSNPSPTDPVTYTITLTATNAHNCPSVISKEVTVMPAVHAGFSMNTDEGCNPLEVAFTNSSTGALSFNWDFGNGQSSDLPNPTMVFENYGSVSTIYQVKLTATNAQTCQDTFLLPVTVHPHVEANFAIEYQRQCSEAEVTFHNSSVNGARFDWTFNGDPLSTTSSGPIQRNFINNSTTTTATYPVHLLVTSAENCTAGISKEVDVFHRVTAAFTSITEGCTPLEVEFTNTTEGGQDYKWEFGDNTSSILTDPTHTFQNEGNVNEDFTVKLLVISDNFCRDSAFATITAFPKPKARFDSDRTDGCSPLEITVENLSVAGTEFTWSFGDGSPDEIISTTATVNHSYTNDDPAVFNPVLRLDVSNDQGCTDFITQTMSVYPSVDADFQRDSAGCTPFTTTFTNLTRRASTYEWDFDDGGFSYIGEPGHTFINSGVDNLVLDVQLKGISEYGCTDSAVRQVTIYPAPTARFNYNPIYQYYPNSTVTLVNETNDGDFDFEWDFDDGVTSISKDPGSHQYTDWGEYDISLRASNEQCSDSVSHWIKIYPPQPIALYVPDIDSGCVPLTVAMTNNSLYGETYLWEFDDGVTSTEFEPVHTFEEAGIYQVKLTVFGEGGLDITWHEFKVFPLPEPLFVVKPELVMLPDEYVTTYNFSKNGETFQWDMGDFTIYDAKDTIHLYKYEGWYDVKLTAWSDRGCQAELLVPQAVQVIAEGRVEFPTAFMPEPGGSKGGAYSLNDVTNAIFYPPIQKSVLEYKLIIYNRWGERLFTTNDINIGWDGYHNGTLCAQGVYFWRVQVTYANYTTETLKGDITLLHRLE